MKDYYTITDGQGNFVFFDMTIHELKFDSKVARRSGMAYTLEKAEQLKEKALNMYYIQVTDATFQNDEFQSQTQADYASWVEPEQIAKGKAFRQKYYDELLKKKFSIVKVTYEVLE